MTKIEIKSTFFNLFQFKVKFQGVSCSFSQVTLQRQAYFSFRNNYDISNLKIIQKVADRSYLVPCK